MTISYRANVPINRHVAFTWLVGGGMGYRPEQITSVTKEVLSDGELRDVNTRTTTSSWDYAAATARLDVEFRIAPSVSVVPRVSSRLFRRSPTTAARRRASSRRDQRLPCAGDSESSMHVRIEHGLG